MLITLAAKNCLFSEDKLQAGNAPRNDSVYDSIFKPLDLKADGLKMSERPHPFHRVDKLYVSKSQTVEMTCCMLCF